MRGEPYCMLSLSPEGKCAFVFQIIQTSHFSSRPLFYESVFPVQIVYFLSNRWK